MVPVSVVIPLFNKGPHVERALRSVLQQTVQTFEIVVIDDGSTDWGSGVVVSYTGVDGRIRLIRQENKGVSAARNRGICEAKSDLIAFLDADDEWEKDHLETLLRLRNCFPLAGAYTTAYAHFYPSRKIVTATFKDIPPEPWEGIIPDYFKTSALSSPPVWTSAVAVPRDVFNKVGFFKVGERRGEDLDMWGRIALHYPIVFSWRGVAFYHLDATKRACQEAPLYEETPFLFSVRSYFGNEKKAPFYIRCYLNNKRIEWIISLVLAGKKKKALHSFFAKPILPSGLNFFLKALIFLVLPLPLINLLNSMYSSTR